MTLLRIGMRQKIRFRAFGRYRLAVFVGNRARYLGNTLLDIRGLVNPDGLSIGLGRCGLINAEQVANKGLHRAGILEAERALFDERRYPARCETINKIHFVSPC